MHQRSRVSARVVVRACAALVPVVTTVAFVACGDGMDDAEYLHPGPTYPEEDTGTGNSSGGGGSILGLPESGVLPSPESGTGDPDGGTDADVDASDAADADPNADADLIPDATADAGHDLTLGAGPLAIAYAGLGVGIDAHPLTSSSFAGTALNAWSTASDHFDHGTTVVSGNGASGGVIAWGHWAGGIAQDDTESFTWPTNGGAVYVVGQSAGTIPAAGAGSLPVLGTTPAIVADGSAAPGTVTASAAIAYSAGTAKVGFTVTLAVGGNTYTVMSTGGAANATTSETVSDATGAFAHTYSIASASPLCGGTCLASVRGFVAGASANDVALAVHVYKDTSGAAGTVSGAVAFGP